MKGTVAILATLDTKGEETDYIRGRIKTHGCSTLVIDMGVVGEPAGRADVTREEVANAGGRPLAELLQNPTRQESSKVMIAGASKLLGEYLGAEKVHAVLGIGGTQGTSCCSAVMQNLPYGFPKVMVSTVASGDCSPFVGIKDITMMFSVSDILGLNPLTRKILANAAGAVCGMVESKVELEPSHGERPVIGMTNLGVLTEGAVHAMRRLRARGYEVIVFHAVGSGGTAMEQMMKDGLIGGVFDYALGEITDELFDGLRAATEERLTTAGRLGLPQIICPGGAEHLGLLVPPNTVPERWKDHKHVFHSPIVLAPRLSADEFVRVAREVSRRLEIGGGEATLMFPSRGTSRYSIADGPLYDPVGDSLFLEELRNHLPENVKLIVRDAEAEDPAFVDEAVDRLAALIESDIDGVDLATDS